MKKPTLDEVVARLEAQGRAVTKSGGVYRAQCPAHNGDGPSLAVSEGKDGKVLTICHSKGCDHRAVMESLGFGNDMPPLRIKPMTKRNDYGKRVHLTLEKAVEAAARGVKLPDQQPEKIYRYDNEDGSENLFICRWRTEDGKIVRPVSKVDGGYICGTKSDEGYPLYRLPQVVEALKTQSRIYICEGEKATDAAVSLGLTATCSPFGSKSPGKAKWFLLDNLASECNTVLEIIILPDNDQPGLDYAETLADIFARFKSKPSVKVVSIADFGHVTGIANFPEGGDVADLLEILDGKTTEEIREMIETVVAETEGQGCEVEEKLEYDPFPVDVLPQNMARLCIEAGRSKNIDPIYIALPALSAVASAIGSAYKIALKDDWQEPSIVWTCIVCESGSGKTPGLDSAVEPLRLIQKHADDCYELRFKEYEREKEQYDLEYGDYKRSKKARATYYPPEKPVPPFVETYLLDDATLEAVCEVLEQNPHGVLLVKDELSGWFNSFDCYRSSAGGSKDLSSWLSIHGGKPFRINRKTGKQLIRSSCPTVSLCGGIQPHVLQRIVKRNEDFFDSGLTARILFAMPPDKSSHWTEESTSLEALIAYENIFKTLNLWRRNPAMPCPEKPLHVRLSPEAKKEYVRFFNSNSDERTGLSGDMKASWAKFSGYVPRIALLFHIVERIEDGGPVEVLQADTMQRAIRLVQWFKRETTRILAFLRHSEPQVDDEAQVVLEIIEANGGTVTVRDLQHKRNKYRTKEGAKEAEMILDSLVRQGKLVLTTVPAANGREIVSYTQNGVTGQ